MHQIDREGAWRGVITESGLGETKNGFPKFTVRLKATQFYADSLDDITHFGLTEPGWVDWTPYDQELLGYLTLFGTDKETGKMVPSFQLENVKKALGWDGRQFSTLGGTDWTNREVTFWTKPNEYQGVTSLQVSTIDAPDAPPTRGIAKLDGAGLKDLDNRFAALLQAKAGAPKKTVAGAPPAAGPSATPKSPVKSPVSAPVSSTTSIKPAAPVVTPKPAAVPPAKAPPTKPAPKVEAPPFDAGITDLTTAWDYVLKNKGAASDDAVAEKWTTVLDKIVPEGQDESSLDVSGWQKVASEVVKQLSAK